LLVTLCGLAWGAVLGETTPPPAEERATIQRRLVRGGLGLATAVVAVCVGVVTFRAGWSYWRYNDGEVAREYVRTDTACEKFAASAAWDPKNEKPHLGLAYVRRTEATWVRAGTPEEQKKAKRELAAQSEEEARIALALNPLEPEALYLIGCARNMQDDPEGALQAFRDAFAIRPMERFYAKEVASQLTQMGRIGEAVAFLRARREEKLEDGASRKLLQKLERPAAH
jgi:tetratricopeptide (TPR) repeat protein